MIKSSFFKILLMYTLFALASPSQAAEIFLSDFMGIASGESTDESFAPFMTVNTNLRGGFGADVPGPFASNQIQFTDTGPFAKGIGAHPANEITFHLDEFRALVGSFQSFSTVVGIDVPSAGGSNGAGALFEVFFDGNLVASHDIINKLSPSIAISLDLTGVSDLKLKTSAPRGLFTNHAAWADAKLTEFTAVSAVPEPNTLWLVSFSLVFLLRKKNR